MEMSKHELVAAIDKHDFQDLTVHFVLESDLFSSRKSLLGEVFKRVHDTPLLVDSGNDIGTGQRHHQLLVAALQAADLFGCCTAKLRTTATGLRKSAS